MDWPGPRALRSPRHAGAIEYRRDSLPWMRAPHQLGRRAPGLAGSTGNTGGVSVRRRRRLSGHRLSGSVIAALIVGCCVGVLADWRLRERGPPGPARASEPVVTSSSSREPVPAPAPAVIRAESPEEELAERDLRFPIDRMDLDRLKGGFEERRGAGTRPHEAVDILAPRYTPVYAVENGTIAKLFFSKAGGNTIYQFDPSRRFCYYY